MYRLITALFIAALAACATTHPLSLPPDGAGIEGVDAGDQVRIVLKDGRDRNMTVTQVDESGLHGRGREFHAYRDLHSVSIVDDSPKNGALLLLLALLVVAAFAEPEISGSGGPLCLQSSEGGPCLP